MTLVEPTSVRTLPMFPLGTLAFPGSTVPLHVFEERYRRLTKDCLADDGMFGIVLISRGAEVGGGDVRTDVGTQMGIAKAGELADGRWLLMTVGRRRIRIHEWLQDDPYPRAVVEEWPDPHEELADTLLDEAVHTVRRTRALLSETRDHPALSPDLIFDFARDPVSASWRLCAEAPLSAYDAQRLLATERTSDRLRSLIKATAEVEEDLRRMLAQ